ncbi:MAG: hypothetical protein IH987_08695 [Planctomycetes bacterium]|nr:hypothetical protein [Planctomycetota bacterium]
MVAFTTPATGNEALRGTGVAVADVGPKPPPTTKELPMKDASTPATPDQRDYAMRRVLYNTLIAAKALDFVPQSGDDFSAKEMAKVSGLIMSRNLDDFFFKQDRDAEKVTRRGGTPNRQESYRMPDDIFVADFPIPWQPPTSAMISDRDYERINKLVGHIVADPPDPIKDTEACAIIEPLVRAAIEFVHSCLTSGTASYTGKAGPYVRRLNGILKELGISRLPKPV